MTLPARVVAPIAGAALLGAWVAFITARSGTKATPASSPPAVLEQVSATPSPTPEAAQSAALQAAPSASSTGAAPATSASTSAAASAPPKAAASGAMPTVELGTITTEAELLAAQLECDRKKLPESCERAGRALESGSSGVRDASRAIKLKRVALTLYVKQCEGDRALACTRLAEMHEQGDQVQKNPRNAAALRARVVELCHKRPNQIGCQDEGTR